MPNKDGLSRVRRHPREVLVLFFILLTQVLALSNLALPGVPVDYATALNSSHFKMSLPPGTIISPDIGATLFGTVGASYSASVATSGISPSILFKA